MFCEHIHPGISALEVAAEEKLEAADEGLRGHGPGWEKPSVATRDGEVHGERQAGWHARFEVGIGVRDDGGLCGRTWRATGTASWCCCARMGPQQRHGEFCATACAHKAVSRGRAAEGDAYAP